MYTWGYLKDVSLAKLDLTEEEANTQNLISRFPFYANEVITQVCSSIKPKYSYAKFEVTKDDVGKELEMPSDFVSFGDDMCYELVDKEIYSYNGSYADYMLVKEEIFDTDFDYISYNKVVFKRPGNFYISYNARWYTFDKNIDNKTMINVPNDILDCIPMYIASQCFKIDDEYKSAVFKNEYEVALSRIDNTHYNTPKNIKITGGW